MLKTTIQKDITEAMKAGEKQKLEVLRYLNSQIQNEEIAAGRKELTDEQIVKLINNQLKKIKESLELFQKGKRDDLVAKTNFEIEILSGYLPQQISDEELEKEIDKILTANKNITNPGALIGLSVKALAGKADNTRIAKTVGEKLKRG